jgi:formylglycine-generating enzyme required for sulfatase activity
MRLWASCTGIAFALVACGTPSVHSGSVDGGAPPGSFIVNDDGGLVVSDGLGTSDNGGEGPGVAPQCTDVDKSKVAPSEMANVPEGAFLMGCNETVDTECREDEKPAHQVTLRAFDIDKTEVTEAQYFLCVDSGQCTYPKCTWDPCARPNYPISCVTHAQADTYCKSVGKRLPTEAEWEKAGRGTDGRKFPWGNGPISCFLANIVDCVKDLEPVGIRPQNASPYGVLDLAGNVVEWTNDFYDETFYASSPPNDPTGPQVSSHYVGRGGGFLSEAIWHRLSSRDSYTSAYTRVSLGIRCAK